MNPTERMHPSFEPDGETPVSDNPAFVKACMALVSGDTSAMGWHLGNSVLTHSHVWGFVFRIDCRSKSEGQNSKFFTRYICWSAEEEDTIAGTAVISGLNLRPL
jgi:hypothetical protein